MGCCGQGGGQIAHPQSMTHTERNRGSVMVSKPDTIQKSEVRMLDSHAKQGENDNT